MERRQRTQRPRPWHERTAARCNREHESTSSSHRCGTSMASSSAALRAAARPLIATTESPACCRHTSVFGELERLSSGSVGRQSALCLKRTSSMPGTSLGFTRFLLVPCCLLLCCFAAKAIRLGIISRFEFVLDRCSAILTGCNNDDQKRLCTCSCAAAPSISAAVQQCNPPRRRRDAAIHCLHGGAARVETVAKKW